MVRSNGETDPKEKNLKSQQVFTESLAGHVRRVAETKKGLGTGAVMGSTGEITSS